MSRPQEACDIFQPPPSLPVLKPPIIMAALFLFLRLASEREGQRHPISSAVSPVGVSVGGVLPQGSVLCSGAARPHSGMVCTASLFVVWSSPGEWSGMDVWHCPKLWAGVCGGVECSYALNAFRPFFHSPKHGCIPKERATSHWIV